MGQDDLGHLRAHIHRLADVAVHLKVLEGVLGDSAPHAGLAVFGHDVTARDLDLGAFTLTIATGDLYHGMAHVRGVVEGHRLGVKVQVAQHTTELRRQIDGEFGVGKSPLVKSSLVQDHRQSLDVVLVRRVGFHELQPALHQVLHREVGARPQKHAHVQVLAVVVEAQTHLSGQHVAPGVRQQELEEPHFPGPVQGPHLPQAIQKWAGLFSENRSSCALLSSVTHRPPCNRMLDDSRTRPL